MMCACARELKSAETEVNGMRACQFGDPELLSEFVSHSLMLFFLLSSMYFKLEKRKDEKK